MENKSVKVNVDILVVRDNRILLGLLTRKWSHKNNQVYGVPGRDIFFGETVGNVVKRDLEKDTGLSMKKYEVICVNANYELGNHYIGIGIVVKADGEPKVLVPEDWEKWEWFSQYNIPKNLFPATKNLIDCYLNKKICVSE